MQPSPTNPPTIIALVEQAVRDWGRAIDLHGTVDPEYGTKQAAYNVFYRDAQRHQFEVDCRRVRDTVILPALKQIAEELLEPRGWTCNVRSVEQTIEATLEIYRSDLKTVSSGELPFIGFKAGPHAPHFTVAW